MWSDASFDLLANTASDIAGRTCNDLRGGDINKENSFTAALLARLRDGLNGLTLEPSYRPQNSRWQSSPPSYVIRARDTEANVVRSEENLSGADMLFGFKGDVRGQVVDKALLVQAKLWDGEGPFLGLPRKTNDRRELLAQCKRMKKISPASFVFVYTRDAVRCYDADDIIAKYPSGVDYDEGWDFTIFIRRMFQCTLGDRNMSYMVDGELKPHLEKLEIRDGFMVELEQE